MGSAFDDEIHVGANASAAIRAGDGDDRIYVTSEMVDGGVEIFGGEGEDEVFIDLGFVGVVHCCGERANSGDGDAGGYFGGEIYPDGDRARVGW